MRTIINLPRRASVLDKCLSPCHTHPHPHAHPRRATSKFGDIKFDYQPQKLLEVVNAGHGTMQVGPS